MKRVIALSEVFGRFELPVGPCEVYVSGDASYDESARQVTVKLDALIRSTDMCHKEEHFRLAWLPKPQSQVETVDAEEASDIARDIFHRWVRTVRDAIPASAGFTSRQ